MPLDRRLGTMTGSQTRTKDWVKNGIDPKIATGYIKKDVLLQALLELFPQVASSDEFGAKHPNNVRAAQPILRG